MKKKTTKTKTNTSTTVGAKNWTIHQPEDGAGIETKISRKTMTTRRSLSCKLIPPQDSSEPPPRPGVSPGHRRSPVTCDASSAGWHRPIECRPAQEQVEAHRRALPQADQAPPTRTGHLWRLWSMKGRRVSCDERSWTSRETPPSALRIRLE